MRKQPAPIGDLFRGVMPFVGAYVLAVVILLAAPGIALWLPTALR
jgi:TRAP-type C4-dicarboxylate transport system permease large subunit